VLRVCAWLADGDCGAGEPGRLSPRASLAADPHGWRWPSLASRDPGRRVRLQHRRRRSSPMTRARVCMERRAGRPGLARAGCRSRHRETAWSAGKPGGVRGRPNALVYGRRLSSWVERPGIGNDASDPGGPTLQSPYNRGCILHFFLRHDFCLSFPQAMVAPRATRPQLHTHSQDRGKGGRSSWIRQRPE